MIEITLLSEIAAREPTADEKEVSDLLKLATTQADDKDYISAIASLRRAYSLMEGVATEWPIRTYFRLARYLHLAGNYSEAIEWLKELHHNVDRSCDAREALYKQWGWMQSGGKPKKLSKSMRNGMRRMIKQEMALYAKRQQKLQQSVRKNR